LLAHPREAVAKRAAAVPPETEHLGNVALMHTEWTVSEPQPMTAYAIEVARRQPDGTWCWLIGDPYTVGREVAPGMEIT
jgi:hypothetical protein